MSILTNIKMQNLFTASYFAVTFVLLIAEALQLRTLICFFKPLLIPSLIILYFFSSKEKYKIYIIALMFSFLSNVSFLESTESRLFFGIFFHMIYRFLVIVLIYRIIEAKNFFRLIMTTIPFLGITLYLIFLTKDSLTISFYPSLINAFLMSILGGLSLSNYISNDDKKGSLLLISALLFMLQNLLFIIQKYYFSDKIFQPIAVLLFASSHFIFYKFLILNEIKKME